METGQTSAQRLQTAANRTRAVATVVRNHPPLAVLLSVIIAAGFLVLLLGPVAWWAAPVAGLRGLDRADVLNATRQILLAAVGGLAVLTGLGFTARTYYLTRRGHLLTVTARLLLNSPPTSSLSGLAASTLWNISWWNLNATTTQSPRSSRRSSVRTPQQSIQHGWTSRFQSLTSPRHGPPQTCRPL